MLSRRSNPKPTTKRKISQKSKSGAPATSSAGQQASSVVYEESTSTTHEFVFDAHIPGLLLESLVPVQAAVLSASERLPYSRIKRAIAITEQEKSELRNSAVAVIAKYPEFFNKHTNAIEFATAFMAINAARMDHVLSLAAQCEHESDSDGTAEHVCSGREALALSLVVLAPLAILALILLIRHLRST